MFKKGDRVIIISNIGNSSMLELPLKGRVILSIKAVGGEICHVEIPDKEYTKKLIQEEIINPDYVGFMAYRVLAKYLVRDRSICHVCEQTIKLYNDRLIESHNFNSFICYGSFRPIDL